MGTVIQFPSREPQDAEAIRLMKIADELDAIILKHLDQGKVDPEQLAGLLAHRLGTMMRHMDEKGRLWDACERVLKAQAAIE